MIYQRKTKPQIEVLTIQEDYTDEEGNSVAGVVTYLNEYKGKGVMCWKDFSDLYEELV